MARRNATHVVRGVDAVIDSAHISGSTDVWVDSDDVMDALEQIKKLTDEKYPSIEIYSGDTDRGRAALKLK